MPELLVTIPESSNPRRRNRPGPIAGTSGHDHRNTHTSLIGPFTPRIRAPIEPHGSTAPNSRATPGMRALPNMKKKPGKGLCTAPRLPCHKPDSQRNSAHQETNLLFYIEFLLSQFVAAHPVWRIHAASEAIPPVFSQSYPQFLWINSSTHTKQ